MWRITEGTEFELSRLRVEPSARRFAEVFAGIRLTLTLDPIRYSHVYLDDDPSLRVLVTTEFMDGFELFVMFRLNDQDQSCNLEWMEMLPLPDSESNQ